MGLAADFLGSSLFDHVALHGLLCITLPGPAGSNLAANEDVFEVLSR